MKARRKGTNEPFQKVASVCLCSGGYILIKDVEFEQEHNISDHWQDVRERAAIAAMQCMIKEIYGETNYTLEEEKIARYSVCYADALVKKLKGE